MYFSSSHTSNTRKRGAEEELVQSPPRKKLKPHESIATTVPKVAKSLLAQSVVEDISSTLLKKKSATVKLKPPKEDKEDAYIAYLESKLGMDKGGKKKGKKVAVGDGLDGTLQWFSLPYFDLNRVIGLDLITWADSFVAPMKEVSIILDL